MRPQILCISFSNIQADARVLRQLNILTEFGDVTTLSFGKRPPGSFEHLEIDEDLPSLPQTPLGVTKLAFRRFKSVELAAPAIREGVKLVGDRSFDLVVANEARALPLAHAVAKGAPVWGDMHEWAPEERAHVRSWRLLVKPYMTYVCGRYLPQTHAVTAVNQSIADLYEQRFDCEVQIVRNSRPFVDLEPSKMVPNVIRMAHSGAAIPGRNLEGMIEASIELGDGFSLDLYLVKGRDNGKYWRKLQSLASAASNIRFHDAVKPEDLPATLNKYDIGVFSLPPQTTNHEFMLPNKFFDFVQARLAVVFSPSPETNRLISEFDLGKITFDYSAKSLADTIRSLSPEAVARYKQNNHAAAHALSSDDDEAVQRLLVAKLLEA